MVILTRQAEHRSRRALVNAGALFTLLIMQHQRASLFGREQDTGGLTVTAIDSDEAATSFAGDFNRSFRRRSRNHDLAFLNVGVQHRARPSVVMDDTDSATGLGGFHGGAGFAGFIHG